MAEKGAGERRGFHCYEIAVSLPFGGGSWPEPLKPAPLSLPGIRFFLPPLRVTLSRGGFLCSPLL